MLDNNASPTFYGYGDFPGYICISVNDELIHGIPGIYKLKAGDLVTYDIGVTYNKRICDSAFSIIVPGKPNPEAQKIMDATYESLMESIKKIVPGNHIGDIGHETEVVAHKNGYEVIKDFTGHGCGVKLHEDPIIPNYGKAGEGTKIVPGMTLCIEPMVMTGSDKYYITANGTVISKNHKLTCH
jgi:methionyl aminopeptidase